MNKKFAVYCSGSASRIIKFYEKYSIHSFKLDFIFYDGSKKDVMDALKKYCENLVIYSKINSNVIYDKSDELYKYLVFYKIDFVFCFGNSILKGRILKEYKNKIINFHPSLLPSFPGLRAIDKALKTSVKILGNTAHFIDEGIDSGPIIMQTVMRRDNFNQYEDVLGLQIEMLHDIWSLINEDLIYIENEMVHIIKKTDNHYFKSL